MEFKKIILISMLVMLVCCVSAVSATDINGTDDVSDVIEVDDVTDIVEDVEIDEVDEDLVEESTQGSANSVNVNSTNYGDYFDITTGYITTSDNLTFNGDFENLAFDVFKINRNVVIDASNATFTNIGFYLETSQILLNGGTFISDENTNLTSVIEVTGSQNQVTDVTINVTAPENKDFYAFDLENANYAQILRNTIYYVDIHNNTDYYNYVVKIKGGSYVTMLNNNVIAELPLKDVKYYEENITGVNRDFVGGIVVSNSNNFNFTGNNLTVTAKVRAGSFPTLDAMLIYESSDVYVGDNKIIGRDTVTVNDYSYIYGIDVFSCNNIIIHHNNIRMNADRSGGHILGNGTGAAYCIQLTGPHTGISISNNTLRTKNNGPNAAIYSQNYEGETSLTISGNNIHVEGHGSAASWDVVTGMELQDNNAVITNNIVEIDNQGNYESGYNVYGISYCQFTNKTHTYTITGNLVFVSHGYYTIYLMNTTNATTISNNSLFSVDDDFILSGDETIYVVRDQ